MIPSLYIKISIIWLQKFTDLKQFQLMLESVYWCWDLHINQDEMLMKGKMKIRVIWVLDPIPAVGWQSGDNSPVKERGWFFAKSWRKAAGTCVNINKVYLWRVHIPFQRAQWFFQLGLCRSKERTDMPVCYLKDTQSFQMWFWLLKSTEVSTTCSWAMSAT